MLVPHLFHSNQWPLQLNQLLLIIKVNLELKKSPCDSRSKKNISVSVAAALWLTKSKGSVLYHESGIGSHYSYV